MKEINIAVIGLGYVGLPLAVEFGKKYKTIGFDINPKRISELNQGKDRTLEVEDEYLAEVIQNSDDNKGISFTTDINAIRTCNYFIVTVPTPIDENKVPDLTPLKKASASVGQVLKTGDIVIYESTVYPGATEEECIPVLEEVSGLKFNVDFFAGYSPERINPGDKLHTVTKILKVTSGSTPEVAEKVDHLYKSVIVAGTHKASSIKVAEASKVIENAQRDLNISFVNELALIFDRIGIDTNEVIEAAGTKWNFLKFKPGLVGGHCIGVDPYYLAFKAESLGYYPEVIRSGRRVNDNMGIFVANKVLKLMIKKQKAIADARILVLGVTFKENCPDVRNTKVVDVVHEFSEFSNEVIVLDPWADKEEVREEYGVDIVNSLDSINGKKFDAIVLAVSHNEFLEMDFDALKNGNAVIFDIKGVLPKEIVDGRL
ncbi:nucleotide sugar dehydrogenase [Saccharicrinis sp. FJH54]|uniref:nucleotide sugar dehydrogenase n=1 Tax=Saccharicrinis sp. FJH54 TaxID=3344665 RepID=UPI0035D403F4